MRIFIFLLFTTLLSIQLSFSQTLRDFKKKTEENTKERTAMLDLLRSDIKNYLEQDVVFVVNHFKVYGSYAWMEGTVQRKDGKEIVFTEDAYDCCHVEALFKKVNGSWILKLSQ
jgi:endoglucanase Acf2